MTRAGYYDSKSGTTGVFLGKRRGEVEVMEELEMIGKRRESGGDGLLDSVYLW